MKKNFNAALKGIAGSEGGYVNHPKDPGGHTNKGVTLATYKAYRARHGKPKPTVAALKNISDDEVAAIFREGYWNAVKGDDLPSGLDYACSDFAFNSGSSQAVKTLQRTLLKLGHDPDGADGKIGNFTIEAIKACIKSQGVNSLIDAYMDARLAFMKGLGTWSTFGKGWSARVKGVRAESKALAKSGGGAPATKVEPPTEEEVVVKASPADTTVQSLPGGTSTITTIGGAIVAGAGTVATTLRDQIGSFAANALPFVIIGILVLTVVGGVVTAMILKRKAAADASV